MTKDKKIRGLTTLAKNLKTIRAAKGWTQDDLAHEAGVSEGTIKKAETEKQSPTVDTLDAIAKAFGVEPWELLKPPESTDDVRTVTKPQSSSDHTPSLDPDEIADVLRAYGKATPDTRSLVRRALGLEPDYDDLRKRARNILQTQEKTPPKASEDD